MPQSYSRRRFGQMALTAAPLLLAAPGRGALAQGKPNSRIKGVQIGVIWVRAAPRSRRPHLGTDRRLDR